MALLVGLVVALSAGAVYLKQQQKTKKKATNRPKMEVPAVSPAQTRKVAKKEGSVTTPAGRRSARIARKMVHND